MALTALKKKAEQINRDEVANLFLFLRVWRLDKWNRNLY